MSLHVALTVDPYFPVPPRGYGGFERVVDVLVRGLVARGHRVTMIGHADSQVPARLIPYGAPPHWGVGPRSKELWQVASNLVRLAPSVDIVHSFGRLAALLPILPLRRLPKVQSYGREIPWRGVRRASWLAGQSLVLTGCSTSLYQYGLRPTDNRWVTIYNPVEVERYSATAAVADNAPLVFLGRVERIKGTHSAIAIARRTGRKLVIAGNAPDRAYFEQEVAPHLGPDISYVGEVDDLQKNALLRQAAAFLMPIEWEEPFGIVMIEAMACGTPVIAFDRGSVREVVQPGETGCIVRDVEGAVAAVPLVASIDRRRVRAICEARFRGDVIVDDYVRLYQEMVAA